MSLSEPLPYHVKIRDYFKRQSGIWSFFSAARQREEQLAAFKTELLKNTYQFHPGSDPLLYEKIHIACEKLGLSGLSVTAYQAINEPEPNASIACLPHEAHIVFSGNLLQMLGEAELLALIAHELGHMKLYSLLDGELETSDRIIMAIAGSPDSQAAHYETARLFRLYTEIYCDREAYGVVGDTTPVITMLLKMATGLSVVHADSYIRQAEEIFSSSPAIQSATLTHPENFIRTRALRLWETEAEGAEAAIRQMIEGVMDLDRLDLPGQKTLSELTEELLVSYLHPKWIKTAPVMSLTRQYFPEFSWGRAGEVVRVKTFLDSAHSSIREYFAYVLLDFALADPDLEDVPAGYALRTAESCGLADVFEPIVKKEMSYSDKQWERQRQQMKAAYDSLKED
ncbi:MAG TPA: M48 family metalloprotease [Puia sp.]|nr:M48 family metalloprotease [Puia sp.]